ncbi:unnamed protein product [Peniophora sp. CBMAI 1063]|nr:unnamed protein product [Peniophora sp. CBMAI 1063]
MAEDSAKLRKKLVTLTSTLDELEKELAPLLAQGIPETTMNLDPIQQAKIYVLLPYLTYDLSFIYLKTRGVDPKTHPVIAELDRVKEYFGKIKQLENPPQRPTAIDKEAAARFIKHGLTQSAYGNQADTEPSPGPSSVSIAVQPKITAKMLERTKWEKEVREHMNEEEDGEEDLDALEVFDEEGEGESSSVEVPTPPRKGKAKAGGVDGNIFDKKRRTAADFFDVHSPSASEPVPDTSERELSRKEKKRGIDSALSSPPVTEESPVPKKRKKKLPRT